MKLSLHETISLREETNNRWNKIREKDRLTRRFDFLSRSISWKNYVGPNTRWRRLPRN